AVVKGEIDVAAAVGDLEPQVQSIRVRVVRVLIDEQWKDHRRGGTRSNEGRRQSRTQTHYGFHSMLHLHAQNSASIRNVTSLQVIHHRGGLSTICVDFLHMGDFLRVFTEAPSSQRRSNRSAPSDRTARTRAPAESSGGRRGRRLPVSLSLPNG